MDDAILQAAKKAGIKLYPLQLVFGPPQGTEIRATITLPKGRSDT